MELTLDSGAPPLFCALHERFFLGNLSLDPQYSPTLSLHLLKVELSNGTEVVNQILPRILGSAASLDCSLDCTCVVVVVQGVSRVFIFGVAFDGGSQDIR